MLQFWLPFDINPCPLIFINFHRKENGRRGFLCSRKVCNCVSALIFSSCRISKLIYHSWYLLRPNVNFFLAAYLFSENNAKLYVLPEWFTHFLHIISFTDGANLCTYCVRFCTNVGRNSKVWKNKSFSLVSSHLKPFTHFCCKWNVFSVILPQKLQIA